MTEGPNHNHVVKFLLLAKTFQGFYSVSYWTKQVMTLSKTCRRLRWKHLNQIYGCKYCPCNRALWVNMKCLLVDSSMGVNMAPAEDCTLMMGRTVGQNFCSHTCHFYSLQPHPQNLPGWVSRGSFYILVF